MTGAWSLPSVPVMRPVLPTLAEVTDRLRAIDAAGWYTNFGPQETELRERFAAFLGVCEDRVATASSATLALQGAATVSHAVSWRVPSFTFPATPSALLQAGHRIRFSDIRADDWWLDGDGSGTDDATEGLVPVAPFGAPIDLTFWDPTREVIIDAAASLGADVPALDALPPTWAVVFSLHATKCLPAGEGGLVVFGDAARAERFRAWTNHGFSDVRESRFLSTNAKLSELAAAYGHATLDAWERIRDEWRAAREGVERLEQEHGLASQPGRRAGVSPYWIVEFPDAAVATAVEQVMADGGIGTRRWWSSGCHRMPAFRDIDRDVLPVTESVAARSLGLPMFRGLDRSHLARISHALAQAHALQAG
jgi:dTDP-4-amino-4,6-dideoxygalactose transaminase